jgi:hypothetical protein
MGDESVTPTPNLIDTLGNIEQALDTILAIQDELIGGDA